MQQGWMLSIANTLVSYSTITGVTIPTAIAALQTLAQQLSPPAPAPATSTAAAGGSSASSARFGTAAAAGGSSNTAAAAAAPIGSDETSGDDDTNTDNANGERPTKKSRTKQ
jgi:hypothetical protein